MKEAFWLDRKLILSSIHCKAISYMSLRRKFVMPKINLSNHLSLASSKIYIRRKFTSFISFFVAVSFIRWSITLWTKISKAHSTSHRKWQIMFTCRKRWFFKLSKRKVFRFSKTHGWHTHIGTYAFAFYTNGAYVTLGNIISIILIGTAF